MILRALAAAVVAVGLCAVAAHADSLDFSDPTVTPSGPFFLWSYSVNLDNAQHIDTAQNAAFITLYDVNGFVASSETYVPNAGTLTGTPSVQNVGITPATQSPTDNPAIPNITVTYTGAAASSQTLGVLSFLDRVSGADAATGNFSAQATLNVDNSLAANTASVPVPAPEPSTLALLASGLGMIGAVLRRRRAA